MKHRRHLDKHDKDSLDGYLEKLSGQGSFG